MTIDVGLYPIIAGFVLLSAGFAFCEICTFEGFFMRTNEAQASFACLVLISAFSLLHCSPCADAWTDDRSRVALTLSWCKKSQVDLDLWLFTPNGVTGEVSVDKNHAVYWSNRNIAGGSIYNMVLELDDQGLTAGQNTRSFGPESLYLEGNLPVGTYAVMVHAYTQNPSSTLSGHCPSVALYSNFTQGVSTSNLDDTATPGPFRSLAPPDEPASGLHSDLCGRCHALCCVPCEAG